jgi:anti-anti-sigma regulatory factor
MLKITFQDADDGALLQLEGSVRGPWVTVLQNAWSSLQFAKGVKPMRVDLSQVSFADSSGLDLLVRMKEEGVALVNPSIFLDHMLCRKTGSPMGFKRTRVGGQQ